MLQIFPRHVARGASFSRWRLASPPAARPDFNEDIAEREANVNDTLHGAENGAMEERTWITFQFHRHVLQVMPSRQRLIGYIKARDEDMAAHEMESNLRALQQHYLEERISAPKPR